MTQAQLQGLPGAPLIARSTGEEVGVRSTILRNLTATLTAFQVDFQSETTYDADIGQDSAGPPSRRYGIELNTTYEPLPWLEFYTTIASSRARYTEDFDDGTGHSGRYIANAPNVIASFAAYVKNLGPWSGGIDYRYLGGFALTPDNAVKGRGYGEWNLDVNYSLRHGWKLGVGLYNALNTRADAAEFWYVDRLANEPAEGVAGLHVHPLEPHTVRISLGWQFD